MYYGMHFSSLFVVFFGQFSISFAIGLNTVQFGYSECKQTEPLLCYR